MFPGSLVIAVTGLLFFLTPIYTGADCLHCFDATVMDLPCRQVAIIRIRPMSTKTHTM